MAGEAISLEWGAACPGGMCPVPGGQKVAARGHLGCVFKEILKIAVPTRGKQDFIKSWLEVERAGLISHRKLCSLCHAPGSPAGKREDSSGKINRRPVLAPCCALAVPLSHGQSILLPQHPPICLQTFMSGQSKASPPFRQIHP